MTLDIRPAAKPKRFDLYEGDDKIGEIRYEPPEGDFPEVWEVDVWNLWNANDSWGDLADTLEEAFEDARACYKQFVAKRCESSGPSVRAISVPTGGQKRRR